MERSRSPHELRVELREQAKEPPLSNNCSTRSMPPHDFLGTRELGGTNHTLRFRASLSLQSLPWLSGYVIQGQVVLPAMWYAAAILEAARFISPSRETTCVEIQNLDLIKAVTLEDSAVTELLFHIHVEDHDPNDHELVAHVEANAASAHSTAMAERTFRAKLIVHFSDTGMEDFASPEEIQSMGIVDTCQFYEYLSKAGFEYSGRFRTLTSVRQKHQMSQATSTEHHTEPLFHPALLDLGLQTLLAAYFTFDGGYPLQKLHLRSIERITFNTDLRTQYTDGSRYLKFQAAVTDHSYRGMTGEVEIFSKGGTLEVQFEGVSWAALTTIQPSDGLRLFAKSVWQDYTRRDAPIADGNTSRAKQITIVGGGKSENLRHVRDSISQALRTAIKEIFYVDSLGAIKDSHLPAGCPVLCLVDLEEPIFDNIDEAVLNGLQSILSQAELIVFVAEAENPYASALVGLLRSLRLEVPHSKIQILSIKDDRVDEQLIAETFMSWIHHTSSVSSKELSWSLEPELRLEDGVLSIPRLLYDETLNNRVKCTQRYITETVEPSITPVEVARSDQGWQLRTLIAQPEYIDKATVLYSTLQPLKLGSTEDYGVLERYLCFGHLHSTSKNYMFLSTSNASLQTARRITIEELNVPMARVPAILYRVACQLLAYRTFQKLPYGSVILVDDADAVMRRAIRSEITSHAGLSKVHFVTASKSLSGDGVQFIPSLIPARRLKRLLGAEGYTIFISCSGKEMNQAFKRCFPSIHYVSFLSDEGRLFRSKDLHEERYYQVMSRIIRQWKLNQPTEDEQLELKAIADSRLVSASRLQDMNANTPSLNIVDWTKESRAEVEIRDVAKTFSLLEPDKTYLLVGLTGTMGRSLSEWMIDQGARNVVLASRDPRVTRGWLEEQSSKGARVMICALDVCDRAGLCTILEQLKTLLPPIAGVANGAAVQHKESFQDMTIGDLKAVLAPKVQGSLNLDEAFKDTPLDFFVMISSTDWTVGSPGQSSSSAANGFMVGLAQQRRKRGLAASVMSLSEVTGAGHLAKTTKGQARESAKRRNLMTISPEALNIVFAEAIVAGRPDSGHDVEVIAGLDGRIDGTTPRESQAAWLGDPRVSELIIDKSDEDQQHEEVEA
ncbi:MAG: hypothetical protein MMC23_007670 [Stictis urceolatum]|nr:hypothetical protein [Stictis urceolata]